MKCKKLLFIVMFLIMFSTISFGEGTIELTDEENQFIEDHPIITLGIDPSFIPFEFIDVDGKYKGLASEYIKLINEMTGMHMIVVPDQTWSEAYIGAVEKDIDVLPCISKTEEREKYFLFSDPYYKFQRVIILRTDSDIKSINDLKNKSVAIQKNSSHQGYIDKYDTIDVHHYNTVDEALIAVSEGKEEAFIGNLATSSYLISDHGLTELQYIVVGTKETNELHFAVRNDWPILQSIINKSLQQITYSEKIEIQNTWVGMVKTIDYSGIIRIVIVVFSVVVLLTIVSFYWVTRLRKEIKKRIEIEAHLKVAKREAELANEVKSNFLARMSHEIRTPLNAITGLSYILYNTELDRSQKSNVEKIRYAAAIMLSIINDILDFSKIEAGKVDIEVEPFDLDAVIKNVLNILSYKIEEKKLDFTLIKEPNLPNNFYGDSKRIEQVLLNIINNAVKFTETGAITLEVSLIGFNRKSYQIEFKIIDTGIGMSESHLEKLFEPFTQEDASISRRFGGTGLGLSIVKSLTEMMSGTIQVNSLLEQGSEFIFTLPLDIDQEKEIEVKKNFKYIKDIKTLVINKDMNALNLTTDYLKSFGIKPQFTSSLPQFIHMLDNNESKKQDPYDLLVIDIDGMSELEMETLKEFDNSHGFKDKNIILIEPFNKDDNIFNKPTVILSKPIFPSILYNTIVDLFNYKVMASQMDQPTNILNLDEKINGSVLIVEDNKTNQYIAKTLLESIGVDVGIAEHGKEAVEMFKNQKFDLILMDLHMPIMNGYDAAKAIKEIEPNITIIAMTADAVDGVKEKCHAFGMDHFISKPFNPEKFIIEVSNILSHHSVVSNEISVFDESLGLKQLGGNKELLVQIAKIFLAENLETNNLLINAIDSKNYQQAVDIVHKIKSSAGSIGSEKIRQISNDLQQSLIDENVEDISVLKNHFVEQLNLLMVELRNLK